MQRHEILMHIVEKEQKSLKLQVPKYALQNNCSGSYAAYVYCSANNSWELINLALFWYADTQAMGIDMILLGTSYSTTQIAPKSGAITLVRTGISTSI